MLGHVGIYALVEDPLICLGTATIADRLKVRNVTSRLQGQSLV